MRSDQLQRAIVVAGNAGGEHLEGCSPWHNAWEQRRPLVLHQDGNGSYV